ncbi:hypothetical protein GCM10022225_51990 [Plantactinospora mayteni]|uniref:Uncharacterized protein n=1 Tax=Plantactinospora mayteni TaxID=566021 RepID=A0ABQ4EZ07_9ACTN|nr:hypothetical protein [Plantactinospora mayteni]GIG99884.1 hypothetical protein Pma05_64570 [Plantactinospora mayteni]
MSAPARRYRYIGPADIRAAIRPAGAGYRVTCLADFTRWVSSVAEPELAEPVSYVVDLTGVLRLAPRRSEHVACAEGQDVLGAGEVAFVHERAGGPKPSSGHWVVGYVSNQSTGYCPDLDSWPAVASALDRAGLPHPDAFTAGLVFRRCPDCGLCNVVRDGDFSCVACAADLPRQWNVDRS